MEAIGYSFNKEAVDKAGLALMEELENIIKDNNDPETAKYVHSLVLNWDEAYLIRPYLSVNVNNHDIVNYVYYLDPPAINLDYYDSYKGINLYVHKVTKNVKSK